MKSQTNDYLCGKTCERRVINATSHINLLNCFGLFLHFELWKTTENQMNAWNFIKLLRVFNLKIAMSFVRFCLYFRYYFVNCKMAFVFRLKFPFLMMWSSHVAFGNFLYYLLFLHCHIQNAVIAHHSTMKCTDSVICTYIDEWCCSLGSSSDSRWRCRAFNTFRTKDYF